MNPPALDTLTALFVIEKTFFANARYWGSLQGSLFSRGGIFAMNTGIESADLNMVWTEKPLEDADIPHIEAVKAYFNELSLPFWWWLFPQATSPDTLAALTAAGFSQAASIPCMVSDLDSLPEVPAGPQNMTVRRVENADDLAWWESISFTGFDFPPQTAKSYHHFTQGFNLAPDSPQHAFVAFDKDRPVGTSLVFVNEDRAGIYFVATLPEARKQGVGLELTRSALHFAKNAGARYATLQSSPDGFRIYQKAGFREYCRVIAYAPPPARLKA